MYKVRIMISIFQGMPRKIPGSYTLVAGFLICQYTFQYTSCILCVTGGILGGTWKVRIRNFTLVAGFLICQYTFQYTSCMLCVTGDILGGTWKVCIRNFTLVAGFLICQYTFQYTSCILCITGGILGGMWKACIRNFTVVVGFLLSSSGHKSVYSMYTGKIKGYTECGVEGICTDFVYLVNNDPWFSASAGMKFVFRTLSDRVFRNTNLRFENVSN